MTIWWEILYFSIKKYIRNSRKCNYLPRKNTFFPDLLARWLWRINTGSKILALWRLEHNWLKRLNEFVVVTCILKICLFDQSLGLPILFYRSSNSRWMNSNSDTTPKVPWLLSRDHDFHLVPRARCSGCGEEM